MAVTLGPKIPIMVYGASGDTYLTQGNQLLRALQVLLQCNVVNTNLNTPPVSPNNGDTYIVAPGGTGAWTGQDKNLAYWTTDNPSFPSGTWEFWTPAEGWSVFSRFDNIQYYFTGAVWVATMSTVGPHGEFINQGFTTEEITLNTAGTTTDSAANLLPANSIIDAVVARVTQTITVATDWALGDAAQSTRFSNALAVLVLGTTQVGLNHMQGSVNSDAKGPVQTASAKLRITTTGTPGAGKIRVTVFYRQMVPPTS